MTAGTPLGASPAPLSPLVLRTEEPPFPAVYSTRTRALHGAFLIDTQVARVWSSKRVDDVRGVIVAIGDDAPVTLTGRFAPQQARRIARALLDAARAVESLAGASDELQASIDAQVAAAAVHRAATGVADAKGGAL